MISPGNSKVITIVLPPMAYGNITNYILFTFGHKKSYINRISAYGIKNDFGIDPVIITEYHKDITITMKNLLNGPIQLFCIRQKNDYLNLKYITNKDLACSSKEPFAAIMPHETAGIAIISTDLNSNEDIFGHIRISGMQRIAISIPILMKGNTANINPRIIDFGIMTPNDPPSRILIKANTSSAGVMLYEVLYDKPRDFSIYFNQTSGVVPMNNELSTLGYVGFHANTPGNYKSNIFIYTNYSRATRIQLQAQVVERSVINKDIQIDVENDIIGNSYSKITIVKRKFSNSKTDNK